jgi:uracil-DNA glycosylase family 4
VKICPPQSLFDCWSFPLRVERTMDELFKQKLLGLRSIPRPTTFSEALLGDTSWGKKVQRKLPLPAHKNDFSERTQVLEALERFAQEKGQELESPVIKIEGGEILLRLEPEWEGEVTHACADSLRRALKLQKELLNIVLADKVPGEVKVMFISETFRLWDDSSRELKEGFINELIVGFSLKTAELFERMIAAMKLSAGEVIIFPVEGTDETDYASDVMAVASFYRPEIIVTLGAKATQRILKSNDRLTQVHGQFFTRKVGETLTFQVVPLFHPTIIETNQNMKKTAWADMQKIMKHLKKLP